MQQHTSKLKYLLILIGCVLYIQDMKAQNFGWGGVLRTELYSRYANPSDGIAARSAGSTLINIGLGPKVWIGGPDFAFSPEVSVILSPLALSLGDFKGLGAVSFPIIGKFEFMGNSNLNKDGKFGFSLGGGVQYNKTELFFLRPNLRDQGVERPFFRTYVVEADFGYGLSGFDVHFFIRYGWANDTDANSINIGVGYDFNWPLLKKATDPNF